MKGTDLPRMDTGVVWKAGGEAEVVFAVKFNHGGGYAYRLCPADQPLTEVRASARSTQMLSRPLLHTHTHTFGRLGSRIDSSVALSPKITDLQVPHSPQSSRQRCLF